MIGPALLAAAVGVPVGAFLNVVVERTPDRVGLRAAGPDLAVPDAERWGPVPVHPFLLAPTRTGRPRRWLAVEVTTALAFALVAGRYGDTWSVLPLLALVAGLVALSYVDLEHLRIPDRITFPTLGVVVVGAVGASLEAGVPETLRGALIGSGAYFTLLLLPHLAAPQGMGFGDVKLALLMGFALGWVGWHPAAPVAGPVRLVLYALMLGCLVGVVFGLVHRAVTRRRGEFPFGPSLAIACLVVVLYAPELRI